MAEPGGGRQASSLGGWHARDSGEFSRVLAFSDGVFAIAMTLLVVGIAAPALSANANEPEMLAALWELRPHFVSFFISFAVIGRYWRAHHYFCSLLRAMDSRFITINLVYLGFIAFCPFPTELLGTYFDNALSVGLYALTVAVISALEVVLLRHARRAGLLRREMPEAVYRWGVVVQLLPVGCFAASVPVAFFHAPLAVAMWLLIIPLEFVAQRRKPAGTDEYFS